MNGSGAQLVADPWLAGILGCPAFHLRGDVAALDVDILPKAPAFVDAKVPATDLAAAHALEGAGFRLADTNLQYVAPCRMLASRSASGARFARPEDCEGVAGVAQRAMQLDRFHFDTSIAPQTADRLKREWAANFFYGHRGDWMVVAETAGRVCGFLQLLQDAEERLVIDLVGVDADYRDKGLGAAMIAFAAGECPSSGTAVVGTQAANPLSAGFYENLGFRLAQAQYVFHFHGRDKA